MTNRTNQSSQQANNDSSEVIHASLEWSKQITTLASGTLVLSATFVKDIFKGTVHLDWLLISSWVTFSICAVTGVLFMGSLCHLFSNRCTGAKSIYDPGIRFVANIHLFSFIIGLVLFVVFTSYNFINCKIGEPESNSTKVKLENPIEIKIQ